VASVDGFSLGGGPGLSPAPSPLPNALNSFFGNLQHQVPGPQWSTPADLSIDLAMLY